MAEYINPFIRGMMGARQANERSAASELNQIQGILGIQQAQQQQGILAQQLQDQQRQRAQVEAYAQTLPENQRAAFMVNPQAFLQDANKKYVVNGNLVTGSGSPVYQAPEKQQLVELPVPGQPGVTQKVWLRPGESQGTNVGGQKMPEILNPEVRQAKAMVAAAGKPVTNVNVSTEKKYGEIFGSKIADSDVSMLETARKAPALAERANNVRAVLDSGKVITGLGADYRLALGKALNLAGNDSEIIANTELLSTDLARNTLDAIKASGLGSGNGFSNADRDFLEKAAGGKITLEASTIKRLADLSYNVASRSAEMWNNRVKNIPGSALQGTGIDANPIQVPTYQSQATAKTVKRTGKYNGRTVVEYSDGTVEYK